MFVTSPLPPDTALAGSRCQDRQDNTQSTNMSTLGQSSQSTSNAAAPISHRIPYYPYETIGPKTHIHYTRPTTSYWQEIIPTSSVSSLPYSTVPPYQYSYAASLTPETSLLLPIRPLGARMDGIAVCSLALPAASMTVVKELARIVADKIRQFKPEVVMGLPTGGLVLAPFVAEELGFDRHIPWGYSHKPWYWHDQLTTEVSCIFDPPDTGPRVYLDPNLLPLIEGKRIALIDDVISSGSTISKMLKYLTDEVVTVKEVESKEVTNGERMNAGVTIEKTTKEKNKGGLGLNIVCVGAGMLQGEKYKTLLSPEVVKMVVGAVESPLLKAVEGGWVQR